MTGDRGFPFIVGIGRSGTTLVRAILDSHPDLAIPGESHFVVEMALREGRYGSPGRFNTFSFLSDLFGHPRYQRWGISDAVVRQAIDAASPSDLSSAIRIVFATYAAHRGKSRYADKTPSYVYHMDLLARLFPEGRFVHVIRDGRDVVLSRLDHPSMPGSLPSQALLWRRGVEKGRRLGRSLGPGKYREIRYEDLVAGPEIGIRNICEFLGLQFDARMLRYPERADEIIAPAQHPESHKRIHLPPTAGLRDWRSQMSRADVELFDVLAGDQLAELGYERGVAHRTLRARSAGLRLRFGIQARRVGRIIVKRLRSTSGSVAESN